MTPRQFRSVLAVFVIIILASYFYWRAYPLAIYDKDKSCAHCHDEKQVLLLINFN